jgi:hypothetical protein
VLVDELLRLLLTWLVCHQTQSLMLILMQLSCCWLCSISSRRPLLLAWAGSSTLLLLCMLTF